MLNNLTIVGRIAKDLEIEKNENENKRLIMVLAVPRSFKNVNGEYETDFIPVEVPGYQMQSSLVEYCRKGDIVGVKGRLQSNSGQIIVVAEKVSFLSTGRGEE